MTEAYHRDMLLSMSSLFLTREDVCVETCYRKGVKKSVGPSVLHRLGDRDRLLQCHERFNYTHDNEFKVDMKSLSLTQTSYFNSRI